MRTFIVTGRLGADAEVRQSTSGTNYVTFRLANNEYFDKNEDGTPKTMWLRVTMFNNISLVNYLKKGKAVIVTGNYRDDMYKSKSSGNCEISRDITANSVEFLNLGESQQTKTVKTEETTPHTQTTMQKVEVPAATMTTEDVKATLPSNNIEEDDLPF